MYISQHQCSCVFSYERPRIASGPCPTCTSHPGPPEAPLPSDMLNECGAYVSVKVKGTSELGTAGMVLCYQVRMKGLHLGLLNTVASY